jgi:hypothetical protein
VEEEGEETVGESRPPGYASEKGVEIVPHGYLVRSFAFYLPLLLIACWVYIRKEILRMKHALSTTELPVQHEKKSPHGQRPHSYYDTNGTAVNQLGQDTNHSCLRCIRWSVTLDGIRT